jgi:hypothetical protein
MTRPKPPTLTQAKRAALTMHTQIVKHRHTECEAKGTLRGTCSNGPLQCAHIVPRTNTATAAEPLNGWALCASHHLYGVDLDQSKWAQLVDATIGFDVVLEMRRRCDHTLEHGLTLDGNPVTPLMWWRDQVLYLDDYANTYGITTVAPPKYIQKWINQTKETTK